MIEVKITDRMIDWANRKVPKEKRQKVKLYTYGSEPWRIFEGAVGQACVMKNWRIPPKHNVETYNFDVIYQDLRWECKTISGKKKPLKGYQAVVNSPNEKTYRKQICDNYIFIRILKNLRKGWIVGYMDRDLFWKISIKHPIGSKIKGMGVNKKAPLAEVKIFQLATVESFDEETAKSNSEIVRRNKLKASDVLISANI